MSQEKQAPKSDKNGQPLAVKPKGDKTDSETKRVDRKG